LFSFFWSFSILFGEKDSRTQGTIFIYFFKAFSLDPLPPAHRAYGPEGILACPVKFLGEKEQGEFNWGTLGPLSIDQLFGR
jgi:hypothetical protein